MTFFNFLKISGPINELKKLSFFYISLLLCGCSDDNNNPLQGYIEGEYTYISTGVPGTLFTLDVSRGEHAAKNQLLFTLDPQPELAGTQAAQAIVEQLQAKVALDNTQLWRQQQLYKKNATDKSSLDEAETAYLSDVKQLENAKEIMIKDQWALQQKTVYAFVDGYINETFFRVGEKVPINQPVLSLLTPDNIKVLFYIPEVQLSSIYIGQKISFTCDGCKEKTNATITYISSQAEYTPPIIYSQQTRYKLVYLVRASMPIEMAKQFHPGQPVDVFLHE